jgi:hypothetical protein
LTVSMCPRTVRAVMPSRAQISTAVRPSQGLEE